ncbi:MAG TPA: diguanylate cyclase response regulator [Cyanobacteria bacterium UBA8553]|nr:diguanylate cyclase response regulator [Cyanobacteria bacterium UBA8553]HAJ60721.1 diguanylate cyclase response regulator [Cyanobacteria bacterium UBA8543]
MNPDFQENQPLIIVVDDLKMHRGMLRYVLQKDGYRVVEANSGEMCLALCQQLKPDLILMDALMPGMDGFTCCAQLQNLLGDNCPLILMITVLDDELSVAKAFDVGAIDYITKPIHWAVLRQRVRYLLQGQIQPVRLLIKQLEAANRELQHLASVDGLTAIANRRSFDEYLYREWEQLARNSQPLSLILVDIDFFKVYNDTYGHLAGDECLRQVAHTIYQVANYSANLVARYGGEEFVVILPNTEAKQAVHVAESIRAEVKAKAIAHSSSLVSELVTLSAGVASVIPCCESSAEELIIEADKALYQAKGRGRDRIVCCCNNLAVC